MNTILTAKDAKFERGWLFLDCGGKRSATTLWIDLGTTDPKRRRCRRTPK